MDNADGQFVGQNAVDAVAVAEEHCPGCRLLAVQTTLVVINEEGKIRFLNLANEKE